MPVISSPHQPQPDTQGIVNSLRGLLQTTRNLAGNGTRYSLHRHKIHLPRRMARRRWRHLVVHLRRRLGWLWQ